ncbi:hypothetical protein QA601_07680 [Chitinispirillales bacterium ANBcel5]|uniref:hypothetical protein n=1 Tax=Cellulosispirillum alkaliphilum TaxID=3039283 RepID=UPI002A57570B|nr:hypothetical protein [Chitinispirillales bacterium ANBcel5]
MTDESHSELEKVLRALENKKYRWRTIQGIAEEECMSAERVECVIHANKEKIVRSSLKSEKGETLYTTRRHYKQNASVCERIVASFKNRIA